MKIRLLKKEAQRAAEWSGGTTTQLAIWPEGAEYASRNFEWRISSARVTTAESDFTPLPYFHRILMTLSGKIHLIHKMHLGKVQELDVLPFMPTEFEGAWSTHSVGKCWDFNLMTNVRSGWHGIVKAIVPGSGSEMSSERLTGAFEAFYCLCHDVEVKITEQSGEAHDLTLHTHDFMLLEPELSEALTMTLFGPCKALGVRVTLVQERD